MNDTNTGSYPNGSIQWDLSTLSNANKFVDFNNSFITIPLVMTLQAPAGLPMTGNVENGLALSLKNSVFQLIDSVSLSITNNSVTNTTSYSNLDIQYKLLSQWSNDDSYVNKDTYMFGLDTPDSIGFTGAAASQGIASTEFNNVILPAASTVAGGWGAAFSTSNAGRLTRMKDTSFDCAATNNASFTSNALCAQVMKNYVTASNSTTCIQYNILAIIPCRMMHDIFAKIPLVRGIYCTLTVATNTQAQCVLVTNAGGTAYASCNVSAQKSTLPFMISPVSTAGGSGVRVPAVATTLTASIAIGKSYDGTIISPFYSSCRFYAALVEMESSHEELYLTNLPSKTIKYNDILQFQTLSVAVGGSFSQVLTNSVARARYLLGIPFLDTTANGGINPMSSPFTSCPATTAAYAHVTNWNILISGQQQYPANLSYSYDNYLTEIRGSGAINGGLSNGINSGLISRSDWESGYHFIYCDLSRKISDADDNVPRAIQVQGVNSSLKVMSYIWIIGFEREITMSTSTGNIMK